MDMVIMEMGLVDVLYKYLPKRSRRICMGNSTSSIMGRFYMGCWERWRLLPLFGKFGTPSKQWRYTSASDADARQVQASYWALQWAKEQGRENEIGSYTSKQLRWVIGYVILCSTSTSVNRGTK